MALSKRPRTLPWPSVALSALLLCAAPHALSQGAGGSFIVAHDGAGPSAAALCQILILVGAVLVFDLEDGLGLAAGAAKGPATVAAYGDADVARASAECSVRVRTLRVVLRGEAADGLGSSYVSGPPAYGAAKEALPLALRIPAAAPAAVVVCGIGIFVNAILLGGGAHGLAPGSAPSVFQAPLGGTGSAEASASCSVAVDRVIVETG